MYYSDNTNNPEKLFSNQFSWAIMEINFLKVTCHQRLSHREKAILPANGSCFLHEIKTGIGHLRFYSIYISLQSTFIRVVAFA